VWRESSTGREAHKLQAARNLARGSGPLPTLSPITAKRRRAEAPQGRLSLEPFVTGVSCEASGLKTAFKLRVFLLIFNLHQTVIRLRDSLQVKRLGVSSCLM
jgi:hypothetical protein